MARKRKTKTTDAVMGFGKGVMASSLMAGAMGEIGGSVAAKGQEGMQKMAGFFPVTGNIIGAGMAIGSLGELVKAGKVKVTRRKRR